GPVRVSRRWEAEEPQLADRRGLDEGSPAWVEGPISPGVAGRPRVVWMAVADVGGVPRTTRHRQICAAVEGFRAVGHHCPGRAGSGDLDLIEVRPVLSTITVR